MAAGLAFLKMRLTGSDMAHCGSVITVENGNENTTSKIKKNRNDCGATASGHRAEQLSPARERAPSETTAIRAERRAAI
jgi:hypothetical protein